MIPNDVWKCPRCDEWNRITLQECPRCKCLRELDPDAETKIMPPIKIEEENKQ
jgi:phage FluMu protein Com